MLDGLIATLSKYIPAESIDGSDPAIVAEAVDLEIAYSPVVVHPIQDPMMNVPPTSTVTKADDGRYCIIDSKNHNWAYYTADQVRVMRARYLLVRGLYWRHLNTMPHRQREEVLARYFPDGVWTPQSGSDLAKAMGVI